MARVLITLKIMPKNLKVDLSKLEEEVFKKIDAVSIDEVIEEAKKLEELTASLRLVATLPRPRG